MIVVSDTSPLNYLVLIHEIEVLPKLFQQVYMPPSVIVELTRLKTPEVVRAWADSPPAWLTIVAPRSRLSTTASLGDRVSAFIGDDLDRRLSKHLTQRAKGATNQKGLANRPLVNCSSRSRIETRRLSYRTATLAECRDRDRDEQ